VNKPQKQAGQRQSVLTLLVLALCGLGLVAAAALLLRPGAPPPPAMAPGWRPGPVLDADGFRFFVLEPEQVNFGVGEGVLTGQLDCGAPGYWAQRIKPMQPKPDDPAETLRYFKLAGEVLQAGPAVRIPAGYGDTPLLAWPDGRILSLGYFREKEIPRVPVTRAYQLVQAGGGELQPLERYSYSGAGLAGSFAVLFPAGLQLLMREETPPPGPFPVQPWLCPPAQPGRPLPPVSAVATGSSWRGAQRLNVLVDEHGRVLLPNADGTAFEPQPQWEALGAELAKAGSYYRQVALADDFVMYDTAEGEMLAARDGSRHLISLSTGQPRLVSDPTGRTAMAPAPDVCGPHCRIRALDGQTLVLKDDNFNRLVFIRRSPAPR
jgi:hypothetical protein